MMGIYIFQKRWERSLGFKPINIRLKGFLLLFFSFSEEKFKKIDDEFTKCNTFLVSCLGNIAKRGAFPHCKLLRLSCWCSLSVLSIENSLHPVHWQFFFFHFSGVLGFCFSINSKYSNKGLMCHLLMHYWWIIRPV